MANVVERNPKGPFSLATTLSWREGATLFFWIALIYHWNIPYNAVKQADINNHLLSIWYDSPYDWTAVSLATGEHFTLKV